MEFFLLSDSHTINRPKALAGGLENSVNIFFLEIRLGNLNLIFSFDILVFEIILRFLIFPEFNHLCKISEECFRVIK